MKITQIITTYFPSDDTKKMRLYTAIFTAKTWFRRSNPYHSSEISYHIADDGSDFEDLEEFLEIFDEQPLTVSTQHRQGVGASLNKGFKTAFEVSDCVLYAVDDWSLVDPFSLTPWQYMLQREDIGMVRLGPPHPNTSGTVEMLTEDWQGWGLRLDRKGFAFGHRPALYHKRMIDYYGWFEEGVSALECERLYNEKFCADPKGPDIVLALPHPWYHIDTPSLSAMEPK